MKKFALLLSTFASLSIFIHQTTWNLDAIAQSSSSVTQGIAACKFYRPDQIQGSNSCPPTEQGFRCEPGLTFKSPLLISYIEEASKITGVPAPVLAGIVRMESTVPLANSVTKKSYSISDYTDEDIKAMEEFSAIANSSNIDTTIGDTNKALCPRSTTNALGITQIQRQGTTGNDVNAVNKGAQFLSQVTGTQKNNSNLSYSDYCNPRYSVILAGGFILGKLGEASWQQPTSGSDYQEKVLRIARLYYGEDAQLENYRQGLWQGVNECKTGSGTTTSPASTGSSKSNKICVKVGNPIDPKPIACSLAAKTPGITSPSDVAGLSKILAWNDILISDLQTGVWGYFNKMLTNHTEGDYSTGTWPSTNEGNLYWCTFSIIDAYRLAGIPGLDRSKGHGAVVTMRKFWMSSEAQQLGYKYVDYEANNQSLVNVQPGYAMFMEEVPGEFNQTEHVDMITKVDINENGKGKIFTNDSNTSRKSRDFDVVDWRILNTVYPVRGFGGI